MDGLNPIIDDLMAAQKIKTNNVIRSNHERENKSAEKETFKNDLDLLLKITDQTTSSSPGAHVFQIEQESINLSSLLQQLKQIETQHQQRYGTYSRATAKEDAQVQNSTVLLSQHETVEKELIITPPHTIEGLLIRPFNHVETDRYLFELSYPLSELTIIDKWARRSTRVWTDPSSGYSQTEDENLYATFMLMDGSRLTISARAGGNQIVEVDLIKSIQHIHCGHGQPMKLDTTPYRLNIHLTTDGFEADGNIPRGFVLFAGGDGNDWFTVTGKLIWGHNTNASTYSATGHRPETGVASNISQDISYHQIEKSI
ncbi:MAG: hypothetical protein LWX83_18745 [Anaerolineae bacterium]|nr:hypothetical protein [Anaerolineae bacterium]